MALLPWLLALHIAGFVLWLGGLFAILRIGLEQAKEGRGRPPSSLVEGLFESVAHPGVMLVLATGILLILGHPQVVGHRWFQGKLVLVAGLILADVHAFRSIVLRLPGSPGAMIRSQVGLAVLFLGALVLSLTRLS